MPVFAITPVTRPMEFNNYQIPGQCFILFIVIPKLIGILQLAWYCSCPWLFDIVPVLFGIIPVLSDIVPLLFNVVLTLFDIFPTAERH